MDWAVKGCFTEFHHTCSQTAKNMRGEREFILECEREEGERRSERRQIWRKTDGLTERENTTTGSG